MTTDDYADYLMCIIGTCLAILAVVSIVAFIIGLVLSLVNLM